ncbi:MAG: crossover junction endodeoxyribonuclease RuvC [Candidatus Colwellbacteria bacterium]|nr:crossover junction endodeoxyribonuclease RuvC [Candidatus Colwellbacteria bacterium]
MVILGIDPGTTLIGFGVIEKSKNGLGFVDYGVIKTKGNNIEKLKTIDQEIQKILKEYKPEVAGIETLYFSKNQKTALLVAEARGVILTNLAKQNIKIMEFDPTNVKATVAGYGRSDKLGIKRAVELTLKCGELKKEDDAIDALAIALRVSFERGVNKGVDILKT